MTNQPGQETKNKIEGKRSINLVLDINLNQNDESARTTNEKQNTRQGINQFGFGYQLELKWLINQDNKRKTKHKRNNKSISFWVSTWIQMTNQPGQQTKNKIQAKE